ncbi:hypothetical protein OSB04_016178 [Centaurea solstitialis]|uniref:Uncharacterized protein n=1 Tax=Centaurea solstitialis TaxID=347529 RepID=A0AA38T0I4_9ASTR|nr:hypothetical protein OSB04_016178 [Centaurea solstitialis]
MATTSIACQVVCLRGLLGDITGWALEEVVIRVDNKYVIALMKNPVFHGRSKYIDTRFHFIRECIENGKVLVVTCM